MPCWTIQINACFKIAMILLVIYVLGKFCIMYFDLMNNCYYSLLWILEHLQMVLINNHYQQILFVHLLNHFKEGNNGFVKIYQRIWYNVVEETRILGIVTLKWIHFYSTLLEYVYTFVSLNPKRWTTRQIHFSCMISTDLETFQFHSK